MLKTHEANKERGTKLSIILGRFFETDDCRGTVDFNYVNKTIYRHCQRNDSPSSKY